ncbi:MAG: hypothetical protein GKR94_26110 [Gammaproteobacteria bacterium]|nr:hypothetical protein [Gammaproteobacteria bacterium]
MVDTGFGFFDQLGILGLVVVSHLILLLDFREGAFTEFPDFFIPFDLPAQISTVMGVGFIAVHGIGLYHFSRREAERDIRSLCCLALILPSLFLVAHMRYLLPLMPLLIFGFALFADRFPFFHASNSQKSGSKSS